MTESEKLLFTANAKALMNSIDTTHPATIVPMMKMQLVESAPEDLSLTFAFPAMAWEQNPTGAIHGGIVGTMFDTAMGLTIYAAVGCMTPTINLNISYLRPAPGNGTIMLRATVTRRATRVVYASAEMWEAGTPDKIVATAQGVFHVPAAAAANADPRNIGDLNK